MWKDRRQSSGLPIDIHEIINNFLRLFDIIDKPAKPPYEPFPSEYKKELLLQHRLVDWLCGASVNENKFQAMMDHSLQAEPDRFPGFATFVRKSAHISPLDGAALRVFETYPSNKKTAWQLFHRVKMLRDEIAERLSGNTSILKHKLVELDLTAADIATVQHMKTDAYSLGRLGPLTSSLVIAGMLHMCLDDHCPGQETMRSVKWLGRACTAHALERHSESPSYSIDSEVQALYMLGMCYRNTRYNDMYDNVATALHCFRTGLQLLQESGLSLSRATPSLTGIMMSAAQCLSRTSVARESGVRKVCLQMCRWVLDGTSPDRMHQWAPAAATSLSIGINLLNRTLPWEPATPIKMEDAEWLWGPNLVEQVLRAEKEIEDKDVVALAYGVKAFLHRRAAYESLQNQFAAKQFRTSAMEGILTAPISEIRRGHLQTALAACIDACKQSKSSMTSRMFPFYTWLSMILHMEISEPIRAIEIFEREMQAEYLKYITEDTRSKVYSVAGRAYISIEQYQKAATCLCQAMEASTSHYMRATNRQSRADILSKYEWVYRWGSLAIVRADKKKVLEAMLALETGRGRELRGRVLAAGADLQQVCQRQLCRRV